MSNNFLGGVQNSKPQFLLLGTYRIYEHCGPSIDDHLNYRNREVTKSWLKNCPLKKLEKIILQKKILEKKNIINYKKKFNSEIENIFSKCNKVKFKSTKLRNIKIYA